MPPVAVHVRDHTRALRGAARAARSRLPPLRASASSGERRSTWSTQRSGTTLRAGCLLATTPTFTVTPGHRPFSACIAILAGRLQHGVATLLGLDARVRCATRERDRVVGDALARAHDVAVGSRALEHEGDVVLGASARITGRENGEPISSSGLQTYVIRPNPSNPASWSASTACNPVSSPPFMSDTPGPRAMSPSIAERPLGDRPVVEDGVHVPDQQDVRRHRIPRACRPRGRRAVARPRPGCAGGGRPSTRARAGVPRTGPRSCSRRPACTSRNRRRPSVRARPRSRRSVRPASATQRLSVHDG